VSACCYIHPCVHRSVRSIDTHSSRAVRIMSRYGQTYTKFNISIDAASSPSSLPEGTFRTGSRTTYSVRLANIGSMDSDEVCFLFMIPPRRPVSFFVASVVSKLLLRGSCHLKACSGAIAGANSEKAIARLRTRSQCSKGRCHDSTLRGPVGAARPCWC
jgi:hypothetical protein